MMENQSQSCFEEDKKNAQEQAYNHYLVLGSLFEVEKRFEILQPLGQGAYGSVVSAKDHQQGDDSDNVVAIKKIAGAFEHTTLAKRTLREIKILRLLNHKNVISLKSIMKPKKPHSFQDLYLVYELMETDLGSIINSQQELTDQHARIFLYQILRGMNYVHQSGLLHRDLKPKNILVNQNCDLKICDFGLAKADIPQLQHHNLNMTDYVATRWYRAPQILLSRKAYTKASKSELKIVDVWSIGLILVELILRKPLLPGEDTAHQIQLIIDAIGYPRDSEIAKIPNKKARTFMRAMTVSPTSQRLQERMKGANPLAIDLALKMLRFDPDKRITIEEALRHPYISELHTPDEKTNSPRVSLFDFEFEKYDFTTLELKEVLLFHNEKAQEAYRVNKSKHPEGILSRKYKPQSATVSRRSTLLSG